MAGKDPDNLPRPQGLSEAGALPLSQQPFLKYKGWMKIIQISWIQKHPLQ